jgi:ribose transport system substrate-binding protein
MVWPDVPRSLRAACVTWLVVALLVGACSGGPPTTDGPASTASPDPVASDATAAPSATATPSPAPTPVAYRIGVSSTAVDDGWAAAMLCSIKAQARASGRVARLVIVNRDTDGAGQATDVGSLVTSGVDAIVLMPEDPTALDDAVAAALDAGIPVVSVRRSLGIDGTYLVATDQEAFGYAGATWLFEQLGGTGDVVYLRGTKGDAIDHARGIGVQRALDEHPDIKVVADLETDWDKTMAVARINEILTDGTPFDGIWTSGTDNVVVDALKTASAPLVPIVGTDHGGFVSQLLTEVGLLGAAVTDPAAVGGAAVDLAVRILDGDVPDEPVVKIEPQVWSNETDAAKARLTDVDDPDIDLSWPLSITIPDRTTYTRDELLACVGP